MKCQIPGTVQKCQGEEGDKSVIPQCRGGQLFELRNLLSLKQEKITPHLEPNLQKMSELLSHLRGRAGLMKKTN